MKKVYIQPNIRLASDNKTMIIATSGPTNPGAASETHWGGTTDPLHPEETPDMKGTGDDDDLTMHTKYRRGFYE